MTKPQTPEEVLAAVRDLLQSAHGITGTQWTADDVETAAREGRHADIITARDAGLLADVMAETADDITTRYDYTPKENHA